MRIPFVEYVYPTDRTLEMCGILSGRNRKLKIKEIRKDVDE